MEGILLELPSGEGMGAYVLHRGSIWGVVRINECLQRALKRKYLQKYSGTNSHRVKPQEINPIKVTKTAWSARICA